MTLRCWAATGVAKLNKVATHAAAAINRYFIAPPYVFHFVSVISNVALA